MLRETARSRSVFQGSGGVLDFGVRDHRRRVEEAELDGDAELGTDQRIQVGLGDFAILDRGFGLVEILVEELIDAGLETGNDGGFLVGIEVARIDKKLDRSAIARDDIDAPLVRARWI